MYKVPCISRRFTVLGKEKLIVRFCKKNVILIHKNEKVEYLRECSAPSFAHISKIAAASPNSSFSGTGKDLMPVVYSSIPGSSLVYGLIGRSLSNSSVFASSAGGGYCVKPRERAPMTAPRFYFRESVRI